MEGSKQIVTQVFCSALALGKYCGAFRNSEKLKAAYKAVDELQGTVRYKEMRGMLSEWAAMGGDPSKSERHDEDFDNKFCEVCAQQDLFQLRTLVNDIVEN